MHYTKSIIILFVILFSDQLSAQEYRSGFIVTHENDTIQGQIQYRSYYQDFLSCLFLKDNVLKEYFPSDIQAFGYDDGRLMLSGITEKGFAEAVVKGTLSLLTDGDQFYVEKAGESYLLERKFVKTVVDGREGVKEDRKWQGILSILISDCITNSNVAVSNIKFIEKSLIKLVRQYNRCKGDLVPEEEVTIWTGVEVGLLAGLGRTSLAPSFGNSGYDPTTLQIYDGLELGKGSSNLVGIFIDLTVPRISKVFSLHTELILAESELSTARDIPTGLTSTDMTLRALQIPIGARASFPKKDVIPFFDLGMQVDLELESTTTHLIRSKTLRRPTLVNNPFEVYSRAVGVYMGAGAAIPIGKAKFSIQVRYTRKAQATNDPGDLVLARNHWQFFGSFSGLIHRKPK